MKPLPSRIVFDTAESATTFMQDAEIVKAVKEIEGGGRLVVRSFPLPVALAHLS